MGRFTYGLLLAIPFLFLMSCGHHPSVSSEPPPAVDRVIEEYKIGVGDSISINVWRNPELSLQVPVRPDGKISLPLVGDIIASGGTAEALSKKLQDKFVNFIRNPQVTVIVSSYGSSDFQHRVRITGAVQQPLSIPFRDGMTILDLVLEAGGLNDFAIANRAILYRNSPSGVSRHAVRLADILKKGKLATNYELYPSDMLIVPERTF